MQVKVCSFKSPTFEKDVISSFKDTGFAVIVDHDISKSLIRMSQLQWRSFFKDAGSFKASFENIENPNLGYKGMKSEKAVGAKVADLKEYFHWQPGQRSPVEIDDLTEMYVALDDLGSVILNAIDEDNGGTTSYAEACIESDNTLLRALYYPALDSLAAEIEPGSVRAAAHEDINFITLLVAASASGLQAKDIDGNWHDVPHEDNSVICNVGDMLQLASGGKYRSTTHRVVNPDSSKADRISLPLFVHPHSEVMLTDTVSAGDYLAERIRQIHQATK